MEEDEEPPPPETAALRPASPSPPAMRRGDQPVLQQVIVSCCASLGYLTIGLVRGFSSPAVPSMSIYSPHLVPDSDAISWICAGPPLFAFLGSLAAGPLMQHTGRRGALLIGAPLFALSWVAIAFSPSPGIMIAARAATGLCVGIVLPSAQVYVSECSHPRIRGRLGSLPAMFMAAGILVAYLLGYLLDWAKLALVSAVFPSLLFLFLLPLPESPAWLRSRGRDEDADRALQWLSLQPKNLQVELNSKPEKPALAEEKKLLPSKGSYSPEQLLKKHVIVPFGLVVGILIFQQFSGIDTIIFYTVSIFQASGSTLGEYEATIVIGVVQLIATVFSGFLIDKFGRRILLLLSGFIMFLSMVGLGWYFYLHDRDRADGLGLIPLISQISFILGFSAGYCNVPFLLMGELLPSAQRSFLSSIAGAINVGSMFLVIKTYPDTVNLIGSEGTFWMYAFFCLSSCFFVGFLLPETKGKSLEEIEAHFKKGEKEDHS